MESCKYKTTHKTLILLILLLTTNAEEDWTKQCNTCKCIWVSGRKKADCTNNQLSTIPKNLSKEIREIDFSNNPLYGLGKDEFIHANLKDIHKLHFQNCSIDSFEETTFRGLALLIELDLSKNNIKALTKNIFKENVKIRIINFSENKIKTVEDGLFNSMTYLQKITLDHNEISIITEYTFVNLPSLQHISLDNNKIKTIDFDLKYNLPKLNSLTVHNNSWVCDCHLEPFKTSVIRANLITAPTKCEEPAIMHNRLWTSDYFPCAPKIILPKANTVAKATSESVILSCKASGDPKPDVDWLLGNRILDRDPRQNPKKQKYSVEKNSDGEFTYSNLTIENINPRDKGEYKCIAKNPGGEDSRNITLILLDTGGFGYGGGNTPIGANVVLIIGLVATIIVALIIILVILLCFCRRGTSRRRPNLKSNDDSDGMEEFMMTTQPEMKKNIITEPNLVSKPPRVSMPGSVISGGTEVSDVKRQLLDDDSVLDDESRSLDYNPLMRKYPILLDSDYSLNQHYPPDLLSFPPRGLQPSPAGSLASTVADNSRLPPFQGPQSPINSPIYDQIYRTLPISRSHSPFVAPPARIPRMGQGYVTIPRRPRQSWSSEPPSSEISEPLYDNLGLRTSCTGSSVNSINKIGESSTPVRPRIDPIAEHCDQPTSPVKPTNVQTLPRNMNLNKLTPSRTKWAHQNAEALRSPEKRVSSSSLPGIEPGNLKKIPPRPPPKPKKRLSTTGPLFEDEGEDGTEV